jgi:hypothetical protein
MIHLQKLTDEEMATDQAFSGLSPGSVSATTAVPPQAHLKVAAVPLFTAKVSPHLLQVTFSNEYFLITPDMIVPPMKVCF